MNARRVRSGSAQNLDSLLDTMANVVGILIVLMAVTQMTVNDAFERIRISQTDLTREVSRKRLAAERDLAATDGASLEDALEAARLRAHVDRLQSDPSTARVVDDATATAQIAQTRLKMRRLEQRIGAKRTELSNLQIRVANYQDNPVPAAAELRLPDPRPAPLGAKPVVFLCRYGRVLFPDLQRLQDEFFQVVGQARSRPSTYFRDHDVGNRDLRWRIIETPGGMVAQLDWRHAEAGETLDEVRAPGSRLQAVLKGYDPERHYVQFYVWGDSYEPYLEARRQAESLGFAVGWEPYEIGQGLKFARSPSTPPTPID